MDFGKAISYIVEDESWPGKIGLGAIITMVPVLNFAAIGYEARVIRNVERGEAQPLPAWTDLSQMFTEGLWLGVARLAYGLPIVALLCIPATLFVGLVIAAGSDRNVERGLPVIFVLWACFGLAVVAYSVLLGFVFPAVTAQYVRHNSLAACFDVAAVARFIRANSSDYLTTWLVQIAIGMVVGFVGGPVAAFIAVIPCVGWIAYPIILGGMSFCLFLIYGHLVGQLLRADTARAATPALPA